MEKKEMNAIMIEQQIIGIIEGNLTEQEKRDRLNNYHESDIADAMQLLDREERKKAYRTLGAEKVSEIFTFFDDVSKYIGELSINQAALVLENMDSDDAVDVLEDIKDEKIKEKILNLLDKESLEDICLICSYDEEQVGSHMTTNYVTIEHNYTIKQAMKSLISQAQDNDNINTIYVVDEQEQYYGAIDLRDLIVSREGMPLTDIISTRYPFLLATEKMDEIIEDMKDYAEDSIPVLDDTRKIIGVITSQDIIEAVDEEMGEDYAKLAGLTAEDDLREKVFESMKKRMPWLILLLFLGMGVSSVIGLFESVVSQIAIIMCFQSLILDMAGNVGTQSLAVTIRVLMDESVSGKEKLQFVFREVQIGGANGLFLGSLSFVFVGCYLHIAKAYTWMAGFWISGCVGTALFLAMVIASLIGTLIPIFFHKIKIDPAVASGPLITTINDLVAVIAYYGLAGILLVGRI